MRAQPADPLVHVPPPALSPRDRRGVDIHARATRSDASVIDMTVTDLSHDGCGVDCRVPLSAGELLSLAVPGRGLISATVRWTGAGKAGLQFTRQAQPVFDPAAPVERRHPRVQVDGSAMLRRSGQLNYSVRLYDLTPHGCKAEFVERPEFDEQVWVKFAGIAPLEARVCWIGNSKVGLVFTHPIHPAVFDLLIARLRT